MVQLRQQLAIEPMREGDVPVVQEIEKEIFSTPWPRNAYYRELASRASAHYVVLRQEGLYSSHVIEWRRARDAGALTGPARPRGRPAADPRDAQIARLTKEKAQLEQELAKARFVVDVQAKLQALLERLSVGAGTGHGSSS